MAFHTALLDLREASPAGERPLMLQPLLFCPVLTWVCRELSERSIERFFVVCDEAWRAEAAQAVAPFSAALYTDTDAARSALAEDALVVDHPVLPLPSAETADGFVPFDSAAALRDAVPQWRRLQTNRLIAGGVAVIDPASTYVDPCCTVAAGVTLLPGTILRGSTHIAAGCEIGPNAMIRDSRIGEGTTVNASQVNESEIGAHTTVGPFAYIRPNCRIGDHCRVGDFVEVKNSVIGDGTKISHLTYVGDSDVGRRVNFGCGTVTTNFDGHRKFRCTIGDDVFLGCNTNLIAPVTLGDRAYTAAGSTVTEDVPADALAVARARQSNKPGWAARFRRSWEKKDKA